MSSLFPLKAWAVFTASIFFCPFAIQLLTFTMTKIKHIVNEKWLTLNKWLFQRWQRPADELGQTQSFRSIRQWLLTWERSWWEHLSFLMVWWGVALVWHGTAQHGPHCWLKCRPMIATWPYFSSGQSSSPMTPQVVSKYRSSTEQSVPVCCPHPEGGGRKEGIALAEVGTIVLLLEHILPHNARRDKRSHTITQMCV